MIELTEAKEENCYNYDTMHEYVKSELMNKLSDIATEAINDRIEECLDEYIEECVESYNDEEVCYDDVAQEVIDEIDNDESFASIAQEAIENFFEKHNIINIPSKTEWTYEIDPDYDFVTDRVSEYFENNCN